MRRLEDWAIVMPETARPDPVGRHLCGRVFGHPLLRDGTFIWTGPVTAEDPQQHTVRVGDEEYELGQAYPFWVRWCVQHGYDITRLGVRVDVREEIAR